MPVIEFMLKKTIIQDGWLSKNIIANKWAFTVAHMSNLISISEHVSCANINMSS